MIESIETHSGWKINIFLIYSLRSERKHWWFNSLKSMKVMCFVTQYRSQRSDLCVGCMVWYFRFGFGFWFSLRASLCVYFFSYFVCMLVIRISLSFISYYKLKMLMVVEQRSLSEKKKPYSQIHAMEAFY